MSAPSQEHIDELAQGYGQDFEPDVEQGLARLHRSIDSQLDVRQARVRSLSVRRWLSIAAGLLVIAVAWVAFLPSDTTIRNDGDQPLVVNLPDGSALTLQRGAQISYGSDFADADRRVELDGQAYFQVAKDIRRPFLVGSDNAIVRVTGTAFNLRIHGRDLEIEVSEGSVALDHVAGSIPLKAKQCVVAVAGTKPVLKASPNLNRHAWRTGHMVFEQTPLQDVLAVLHNNWNVDVTVPPGCDYAISSTFNSRDVKAILDNVARLGGLSVEEVKEGRYILRGQCQ